jgi:hypothetical protein
MVNLSKTATLGGPNPPSEPEIRTGKGPGEGIKTIRPLTLIPNTISWRRIIFSNRPYGGNEPKHRYPRTDGPVLRGGLSQLHEEHWNMSSSRNLPISRGREREPIPRDDGASRLPQSVGAAEWEEVAINSPTLPGIGASVDLQSQPQTPGINFESINTHDGLKEVNLPAECLRQAFPPPTQSNRNTHALTHYYTSGLINFLSVLNPTFSSLAIG